MPALLPFACKSPRLPRRPLRPRRRLVRLFRRRHRPTRRGRGQTRLTSRRPACHTTPALSQWVLRLGSFAGRARVRGRNSGGAACRAPCLSSRLQHLELPPSCSSAVLQAADAPDRVHLPGAGRPGACVPGQNVRQHGWQHAPDGCGTPRERWHLGHQCAVHVVAHNNPDLRRVSRWQRCDGNAAGVGCVARAPAAPEAQLWLCYAPAVPNARARPPPPCLQW